MEIGKGVGGLGFGLGLRNPCLFPRYNYFIREGVRLQPLPPDVVLHGHTALEHHGHAVLSGDTLRKLSSCHTPLTDFRS